MTRLINDDLISRQAAIDAIEHRLCEPAYQHTGEDWYAGMNCAECELYDLPSAQPDAVPVVHGKWIIRDNPGTGWYRITCSECGEDVTATAPCIGFFPNAKVIWNYCPECGARMDGND